METLARSDSGKNEALPDSPRVPYQEALRTWAGHGTGATCSGCGGSISHQEIEYEIELPRASPVRTLHFHFSCYRNWTGRGI